jgi:hypothetical protein
MQPIKNRKTKYIYFFRGDLRSHVGIYKCWSDAAKDSIDISMLTILDWKTYLDQKKLVDFYRANGIIIKVIPSKRLKYIFTVLYFISLLIENKKVVVHLRKQSPSPFNFVKFFFSERIKYIIEIEGDLESEIQYLSLEKNKYKYNFYTKTIQGMKKSAAILGGQLLKADAIFTVTNELKDLFIWRYNKFTLRDKIYIIPTGFDGEKFYPDRSLRRKYRKKYKLDDKYVMIFTGNLNYSWQNIKRSIEVFKLLQKSIYQNIYFVMLIRRQDHCIAKEFIENLNLKDNDYLLLNVPHEEVNGFLNASDLGILLREDHTLNKVASPGKLGEYLSTGLTVLTTKHIGLYSKEMMKNNVGVLIDDIYSDNEILEKIQSYKQTKTKEEQSQWAMRKFSVQAYKDIYIETLEGL